MTSDEYEQKLNKLLDLLYPEFRPVVINALALEMHRNKLMGLDEIGFEDRLDIVNGLVYDIRDATDEFIRNHF